MFIWCLSGQEITAKGLRLRGLRLFSLMFVWCLF